MREKAPEGYKLNPLYIETRSKRIHALLPPSLVESIKERAEKRGVSMNEIINEALSEYLTK